MEHFFLVGKSEPVMANGISGIIFFPWTFFLEIHVSFDLIFCRKNLIMRLYGSYDANKKWCDHGILSLCIPSYLTELGNNKPAAPFPKYGVCLQHYSSLILTCLSLIYEYVWEVDSTKNFALLALACSMHNFSWRQTQSSLIVVCLRIILALDCCLNLMKR